MIPVPGGVRVWLASGVTDMRRGMNTLALQVQEDLGRDPHAGDLYIFRGRRGDPQALPGAPAARARGSAGADILRLLRLGEAVEDRRGRDRDAGGHPAPLEG